MLQAAAGALLSLFAGRASGQTRRVFEVDLFARDARGGASRYWTCCYRANARICLFSLPLLTRRSVGGAEAMIEQSSEATARTMALQFNAGSWPEKLSGFNRFGFIQEVVRQNEHGFAEAAFFGLMTSAPEKSLADARRSWNEKAPAAATVTHGRVGPDGVSSVIAKMDLKDRRDWTKTADVLEDFRGCSTRGTAYRGAPADAAPTFLYALHNQIRSRSVQSSQRIYHAGKLYVLRTLKQAADKHWPAGTLLLNGSIRNPEGHESVFKVWIDAQDAGLPLAFEFRPRQFLELTFERAEEQAAPSIGRLLA